MGLFWEFWFKVQDNDLSDPVKYVLDGEEVWIPEIEGEFYACMNEGAKVKLAYLGSEIIGFMLYHYAYNCVLLIRHMYVIPEHENAGIAKKLVDAVGDVKKLIFQTRRNSPPERMLELTKEFRSVISEDPVITTWEMPWRANGD